MSISFNFAVISFISTVLTLWYGFFSGFVNNDPLIFICSTSAAIAGKFVFDRQKHIKLMAPLQHDPKLQFAKIVSTLSAICLFIGFIMAIVLLYYNVDQFCLIAINIFVCGLGNLYMWLQNIIPTMTPFIYCNRKISKLRNLMVATSLWMLFMTAVFSSTHIFFPMHVTAYKAVDVCIRAIIALSISQATLFFIYILSYAADSRYMANNNLGSSRLPFDDAHSFNNSDQTDSETLFSSTNAALVLKECISSMKIS